MGTASTPSPIESKPKIFSVKTDSTQIKQEDIDTKSFFTNVKIKLYPSKIPSHISIKCTILPRSNQIISLSPNSTSVTTMHIFIIKHQPTEYTEYNTPLYHLPPHYIPPEPPPTYQLHKIFLCTY